MPAISFWVRFVEGNVFVDESPKQPEGSELLSELREALDNAARCIELAKREAARVDAALRAQGEGGAQVEQVLLDNARKGRERLSLLDLRFELPPSPPQELPPVVPPGPAGTSEILALEVQDPQLVTQV